MRGLVADGERIIFNGGDTTEYARLPPFKMFYIVLLFPIRFSGLTYRCVPAAHFPQSQYVRFDVMFDVDFNRPIKKYHVCTSVSNT